MQGIDAYSSQLQRALEKKESFSTYNRDILHAAEIIILGFRFAEKTIYLLSNELDSRLYGDSRLHEALKKFLGKEDTRLHILVERDLPSDHPIIIHTQDFRGRVTLGRVPQKYTENYSFNFMVVDDFGYRFEYNRNEHTAVASFHEEKEKEFCEKLKKFFLSLETVSEIVDIGQGKKHE